MSWKNNFNVSQKYIPTPFPSMTNSNLLHLHHMSFAFSFCIYTSFTFYVGHLILYGLVSKQNRLRKSKRPCDVEPKGHIMYYKCISFVNKKCTLIFFIFHTLSAMCVFNMVLEYMISYHAHIWATNFCGLSLCLSDLSVGWKGHYFLWCLLLLICVLYVLKIKALL